MSDGMIFQMDAAATKFTARTSRYAQMVRVAGSKAVYAQMVNVRQRIIQTTPVDTGNLRAHWSPVLQRSALSWGIGNDRVYAPVLEYGGYRRLGPRTIEAGPMDLGEDFEAPEGIYSKQAPLGLTRKELVESGKQFRERILNTIKQTWET